MRPVHAPEDRRVEPGLEVVERPVVGGANHLPRYYVNRVIRQRRIYDLIGLDQKEAFPYLERYLVPPAVAPDRHHFDDLFQLIV